MTEHRRPPASPRPEPIGWLERRVVAGLERERARARERDDPRKHLSLLVIAAASFGVASCLAGYLATGGRLALWPVVALLTGAAGCFHAASFFHRHPHERVDQDGELVRIRLRHSFGVSAALTVGSAAVLVAGPGAGYDLPAPWWLVLSPVLLVLLLPVVGGLVVRAQVTLDADRLRVRTWHSDVSVGWDDVARARSVRTSPMLTDTVVVAFLDATTVTRSRPWWAWWLGRRVRPRIVVHDVDVDEPVRLRRLVDALAEASPAERRRYLSFGAAQYLRRELDGLPARRRPASNEIGDVRRWLDESEARAARPVPPW